MRRGRRIVVVFPSLMLTMVLAACGRQSGDQSSDPVPPVTFTEGAEEGDAQLATARPSARTIVREMAAPASAGDDAEDLPTGLPPITPPSIVFATNTPELSDDAVPAVAIVKTLRPSETPEATVDLPTYTPVPVVTETMAPTATPLCLPLEGYPRPPYPGPDYPGPTLPSGCVTTTPVPVVTFTPPPTNTSVPRVIKTPRPEETPTFTPTASATATAAAPTLTPVPQVLACATLVAGLPCRGGSLRPSQIEAVFSEACILDVGGKPMLRYRLRLENEAKITLQGQASPRVRSVTNAGAVLGGLSCMTGWLLQPQEVASLVGLVPLASRPPLGASVMLEIRSRTWSCDARSPRFISWEVPVRPCAVGMP